jgi:poly(A) polymerase Pap1
MLNNDSLKEKAQHLVEYARHSKQEDLDNVVKEFVNFIREQRTKSLQEVLKILKNKGLYETIVKEGQGQTPSEFLKRQNL